MKKIAMIQNTDDWYKMRNSFIGASEANIIMGLSKFKTPLELYNQKIGQAHEGNKEPNFIQAKGHKMEEKMRNVIGMLYDSDFEPIVCVSEQFEFLMASLDGYCEKTGIVWENKYVGQDDYDTVASGKMLDHYMPQVQQQLMVTGAPFCVFSVVADHKENPNKDFPFKYAYIEVKPDYEYMKNKLVPALVDFWDHVKTKTSLDFSEKDTLDLSDNEELIGLLAEYQQVKSQLDQIEKSEKKLKDAIFKLAKAKKTVCNGVKITTSVSAEKTVINYEQFVKDSNFSVPDSYHETKKGITTKRITFPSSKSKLSE
jgi:putative phage-type endonuclease